MARRLFPIVALTLAAGIVADAQERKVPEDSTRISIAGCAKGRTFTVAEAAEHEPVNNNIEPGRRFRMSGKKKVLSEIKTHETDMVELTGIIRRADLVDPAGRAVGGGVRMGGGPPRAPMGNGSVTNSPNVEQAFIDVESWRPLPGACRSK
jgi:hypothetical protein